MLSDYIVKNVLEVYRNHLVEEGKFLKSKDRNIESYDKNNLSQAQRKAVIERLSETIADLSIDFGPKDNIERDVFKLLQHEYGARLAVSKNNQEGLIFKEIDENGETVNVLSIEDSRILRQRLEEIAEDLINKNMIE